ncbi:hypothetical protein EDD15DRAFT_2363498 [Pisolithus albus]|nr:hypothetical protein EDD15DRAFT_2363498 [Pisolithus albus]
MYPRLATLIFTIWKLMHGITPDVETMLLRVIHAEAQKLRGLEILRPRVIAKNMKPPSKASGLPTPEMMKCATQEERHQKEEEEAEHQSALAA